MKNDDARPEPLKIDISPDAEGMDPKLFDDLLNSIQEIADIKSGKIDDSDYDIVYLDTPEKVKELLDDNNEW